MWNEWRRKNEDIKPDLIGVHLHEANLSGINLNDAVMRLAKINGVNLSDARLCRADLSGARFFNVDLCGADLTNADLEDADLDGANLSRASLLNANLVGTFLRGADLSRADLSSADLYKANLSGANLTRAILNQSKLVYVTLTASDLSRTNLFGANLYGASLDDANLCEADLSNTILVHTDFHGAILNNCNIYGASVWDLYGQVKEQKDLIITPPGQPKVTVDNIKVAQFIYLLLENKEIRDVIGTIAQKGVLILGRFTKERKEVLDAIRETLREIDFVPMMFDFEKVESRDFTETIKILAGMSRFVIVDITNPKSAPLELQAMVPDYMIPFVPIIQKGEAPFSMFLDLRVKYSKWVLEPIEYGSLPELLKGFQKGIVDRALEVEKQLLFEKSRKKIDSMDMKDFQE